MDAVLRYNVLDTPPDRAFDRITALAARACNTPISIVSIVDTDRIWFKSHFGVEVREIGRDPGLCASAILQDGPWVVEDAKTDPRTLANPLVAGDFGLRFYVGVPLQTTDGHNLGTLCVLDFAPRVVSEREVADLTDLAAIVMDELELRLAATREVTLQAQLRAESEARASELQQSLLPARLPNVRGVELAAEYLPANREVVGGDFYDAFRTGSSFALVVGDVCGHGRAAASLTAAARQTIRALATGDWSPAQVLDGVNRVIRSQVEDSRFCTVALLRCRKTRRGFTATMALGGHPRPLLIRADGSVEAVGVPGPLLGSFDNQTYPEATIGVGPGENLLLYTDGLIEAGGAATSFGEEQLLCTLNGLVERSSAAIATAIIAAVMASEAAPRDDIALLVASGVG
jgi:sigma-B regulation protein RsbU (phosphoserine phosphatase)